MNHLTNRQSEICSYLGLFGALLSAACIFQNFVYFRVFTNHIATGMLLVYIIAGYGFVSLALKKAFAPILLIVAAALILIAELLMILNYVSSLIVILLFLYTLATVIVVFVDEIPARLKQQAMALKAEEDTWKNVI